MDCVRAGAEVFLPATDPRYGTRRRPLSPGACLLSSRLPLEEPVVVVTVVAAVYGRADPEKSSRQTGHVVLPPWSQRSMQGPWK
jgi:hypothetical protein